MPLKPHPTDPKKMVYVSRQYEMPQSYRYVKTVHECKPVYVAQRPWVGLTDEEREEIALEVPMDAICITEAKLKEKNFD
jgi:hypothetical protein